MANIDVFILEWKRENDYLQRSNAGDMSITRYKYGDMGIFQRVLRGRVAGESKSGKMAGQKPCRIIPKRRSSRNSYYDAINGSAQQEDGEDERDVNHAVVPALPVP